MVQLESAGSLEDLRGFNKLEQLKHDKCNTFSMRIDRGWRLTFVSTVDPPPLRPDGSLDWDGITEIEILEITRHYG
jgi:hypothetical protein